MNENNPTINDELFVYQTRRFQELLEETLHCCQARTVYLSRKFGIPQAELRCLMLFGAERYFTAKGIAQKLDVTKSRVTKLVDGLAQKKLIEMIDDPKDARIKLISLTHEGRKKCEQIAAFTIDLHQRILLDLASEDRKTILSSLELLRSSMEVVKRELA